MRKIVQIAWNSTFEDPPEQTGFYLVTLLDNKTGQHVVTILVYDAENKRWVFDCQDAKITAWAKTPEPFEDKPRKISEVIRELEKIRNERGDLPVLLWDGEYAGFFPVDRISTTQNERTNYEEIAYLDC